MAARSHIADDTFRSQTAYACTGRSLAPRSLCPRLLAAHACSAHACSLPNTHTCIERPCVAARSHAAAAASGDSRGLGEVAEAEEEVDLVMTFAPIKGLRPRAGGRRGVSIREHVRWEAAQMRREQLTWHRRARRVEGTCANQRAESAIRPLCRWRLEAMRATGGQHTERNRSGAGSDPSPV